MINSPGRPKKYNFDPENKEQLLSFIKDYNKNHNPYPQIKYKLIWEYSLSLYNNNLFPFETSYDFWKRKGRIGRELVDLINDIEQKKVYISKMDKIDLIDIKDLIEKYGGKYKDILWENLEPYDRHITYFIEKINKLQDENTALKQDVQNKEETMKKLKDTNDKLQKLVYSLFIYSNKENELVNLINTGQSKSKLINLALEKTFEDPHGFFLELTRKTNFELDVSLNEKRNKSNVIPLYTKSIEDEDESDYDL